MAEYLAPSRIAWVDYAKGICIVMVVMMHSTLGVEAAAGEIGWMHYFVSFAAPFRMPDFFLIAGLFLALRINHSWSSYLDKKVLHFVYFYILWMSIQFAAKAPLTLSEQGVSGLMSFYLSSFIEPFGTLWFIYLLPIFFVLTKLGHDAKIPPLLIWALAGVLEMLKIHTGWLVVDEFAARFVYFYSGYIFARYIFSAAEWAEKNLFFSALYLGVWAVANGALVYFGFAKLPVVSMALGYAGCGAIICAALFLSKLRLGAALRYCGENSIVIYLAFFLPMAVSRIVLLKLGIITDIGTISLIVTLAGVITPIILFWAVRNTPLAFLFKRPAWAQYPLGPKMQAA